MKLLVDTHAFLWKITDAPFSVLSKHVGELIAMSAVRMPFDESPLPATITAAVAAGTSWDVIVIGAGPAGAATATQLAEAGLQVLLIDRDQFPRPKVCGCCLSPLAVDELRRLGMAAEANDSPDRLPLEDVQLIAGGRTACLSLPAGVVQSRETLDPAIIRRAIAAGAAWLPKTRVPAARPNATGVEIVAVLAGGREQTLTAQRLVLAGGLAEAVRIITNTGSRTAQRKRPSHNLVGLGATLPGDSGSLRTGRLVMAVARSGYCGLVRLEDGRIDLAAAVTPASVAAAGSPAAAVVCLLTEAGRMGSSVIDPAAITAASIRATPPLTHQAAPVDPASELIYRVGDATGYVEPFTGEGIGWALHGARLLAESLVGPGGQLLPPATVAANYRQRHRRGFARRHRRCRRVASALRHPLLVAAAVRAAAWLPGLAGRVARLCTGNQRCGPAGEPPAATSC